MAFRPVRPPIPADVVNIIEDYFGGWSPDLPDFAFNTGLVQALGSFEIGLRSPVPRITLAYRFHWMPRGVFSFPPHDFHHWVVFQNMPLSFEAFVDAGRTPVGYREVLVRRAHRRLR